MLTLHDMNNNNFLKVAPSTETVVAICFGISNILTWAIQLAIVLWRRRHGKSDLNMNHVSEPNMSQAVDPEVGV
jgi:hypothetical protein